MKLALAGYGRMGREIEAVAIDRGHTVGPILTSHNNRDGCGLTPEALRGVDVVTDFSAPAAAIPNLERIAAAGKNAVVGTTGWMDEIARVESLVAAAGIGVVYAANFSLGMRVFYRVVEEAARRLGKLEAYDCFVHEWHHRDKADAPSGTARELGDILLRHTGKTAIATGNPEGKISRDSLSVASTRAGSQPGMHVVGFDSEGDTIELRHSARSRREFARGAVIAAEWIAERRGLYTADDILEDLLR